MKVGKVYIIDWIDPVSATCTTLNKMVTEKYPIHQSIGWVAKIDNNDIYIQTDRCLTDDIGDYTLVHKALIIKTKELH